MSFVLAALVAAEATTANVVGIGVDDLVLSHPDPPPSTCEDGLRRHLRQDRPPQECFTHGRFPGQVAQ